MVFSVNFGFILLTLYASACYSRTQSPRLWESRHTDGSVWNYIRILAAETCGSGSIAPGTIFPESTSIIHGDSSII